jgi:hypothetical protein
MRRLAALVAALLLAVPATASADGWSHSQLHIWRNITRVFPKHYMRAHYVALCESGLTPRATNGQYHGVYQLSASWRAYFGIGEGFDPEMNIRSAHAIYRAQGWEPWDCRPPW